MRVLGVDLAWADATTANETGVVAAEPDGTIVAAGWTTGVEETVAWANTHATDAAMLSVDAPLVVLNADKQRLCEKQVGQRYGHWKVSANSTNLASPRLAGVRFKRELEACGWIYADGIAGPPRGGRTVSECYPYTTIVGTDELGYESERPRYKRKPRGLSAAAWRPVRAAACDVLIQRIADLRSASPALDLRSHPVTAQLLDGRSPLDDRAYKHREDLIDACLAAWTAALWIQCGVDRCQVLGQHDLFVDDRGQRATIIAPARPTQRVSAPAEKGEEEPAVRAYPVVVAEYVRGVADRASAADSASAAKTRAHRRLLEGAAEHVEAERFQEAILIVQAAAEACSTRAITALLAKHPKPLRDALHGAFSHDSNYNLTPPGPRKVWAFLASEIIADQPFWSDYTNHVKRRNDVAHNTAFDLTKADAEKSLRAATQFIEHIETATTAVLKTDW